MRWTDTQLALLRHATALKTVLTVLFLALGAGYVAANLEDFRSVPFPSTLAISAVIAGFITSVFCRAVYNYVTSRRLGADLSLAESFMLSSVVSAGNTVLPANPGAAFRAIYLRKVHSLPYSLFASSTVLYIMITSLMMSLAGLVLILLIGLQLDYSRVDLFMVLLATATFTCLGLIPPANRASVDSGTAWSTFRNGYFDLTSDRRLIAVCVLAVSSNFIASSTVWVIALREYSPGLPFLEASLFSASQIVSGLINLTPGATGFQEVVGIYVGNSFSISLAELLAALIWVRVVRTLAAIVLGSGSAVILRARARR